MRRPLKNLSRRFIAILLGFFTLRAAATYYVDINSTNPTPPYTDWSTAATNIQNAIDAASPGDTVLVTNGVYQTGGETVNGYALTNRVAINKAITVQSVNGPAVTFIQGYQVPGTTNGNSAVRCVYMTNNAALTGFTITGGATLSIGSSTYVESGGGIWCESQNTIISNCDVIVNTAASGGGGVYQGTLLNSILFDNSANIYGGGAYFSYIVNCSISGNSTSGYGGGACNSTMTNCTITGNSGNIGGGTYDANLVNCINYYNISSYSSANYTNYANSSLSYCCTTPDPGATGNITNEPMLISISQISSNSPCRGAGAAVTSGVDINGNPWANPPSIGCEEPYPGSMFGNLNVNISASGTNIAVGYPINFQANVSGPAYAGTWNFGDGTIITNEPYASHIWSATGSYPVVLTAYNDSYPAGQSATNIITVYQPTIFYVVATNHTPIAPYDSWAKAATNIQNAINVAIPGGLVLVSNGVYSSGSFISSDGGTNRVLLSQPMTLQSVNGPSQTYIKGGNVFRCVYLTNGAVLNGFTLIGGNAAYGAGVYAPSTNAVITNCLITQCSAAKYGGGASSGTLYNCTLLQNSVRFGGGGSFGSTLNNCMVASNTSASTGNSDAGGGICGGILNNCTIISNSSSALGGGVYANSSYPVMLNNCMIISNSSIGSGGGVYNTPSSDYSSPYSCLTNCIITNCILTGNNASYYGSAAFSAQLDNSIISNNIYNPLLGYNSAIEGGLLNNCIVIGNEGVGADGGFQYLNASRFCILNNCAIIANVSGGAYACNLNQCTLSQNVRYDEGAGATFSSLIGCLILSNVVENDNSGLESGGGLYICAATNCILAYNIATNGGGAFGSTLVNCTIVADSAIQGGGVYSNTLTENCILYYNNGGDYYPYTSQFPLNYCCTARFATNGLRNITSPPLFVNLAGNDFHLQSTSPCINSGNNTYILSATDLDGNSRITGGTVDIGAYEYQTPASVISYAYLQQYGLPTDGSIDFAGLDGTGFNVYQDWIAGLNPTNSSSVLAMLPLVATNNVSGITVTWQSVSGILYNLQRSTNLSVQPVFTTVQANITGQGGTTSYQDTSATNNTPYFYRVVVP